MSTGLPRHLVLRPAHHVTGQGRATKPQKERQKRELLQEKNDPVVLWTDVVNTAEKKKKNALKS